MLHEMVSTEKHGFICPQRLPDVNITLMIHDRSIATLTSIDDVACRVQAHTNPIAPVLIR
jgi:hypothetical protein